MTPLRLRTLRHVRTDRWVTAWLALCAAFWGALWWVLK